MPTYLEVQQRIAIDCLNRFDMGPEIKRGIQQTIRNYENERYWFNETSTALACVKSSEVVTVPADFLFLDRLSVLQNSVETLLVEQNFKFIRQMNNGGTVALPTVFARYGNAFHLASVPDSAYALPCYYVHRLSALSADSDTNKWLSAAEDVIVYGAAKKVAADLRNIDDALTFAQLESRFYIERLITLRDQKARGKITPTRF